MNLARKIAGNSLFLTFSGILAKLAGLGMTVALTRFLGPDRYGDLTLAYAFMTMYLTLSSFGIERAATLEIGQRPKERDTLLGSAFVLRILVALATFSATLGLIPALGYSVSATELLYWTTPLALIAPFSIPRAVLLIQERIRTVAILEAVNPIVTLIGVLVVVLLGSEDVRHVIWCHIAGTVIGDLLYFAVGTQSGNRRIWLHVRWNQVKELFIGAWPLISISILGVLQLHLTRLLFGRLYPSSTGALYSLALNLAIALRFIPNTYFTSVYPMLSRFSVDNKGLFEETCALTLRLVILCGIPVGMIGTLAPQTIITLVAGVGYLGASHLFSIFVWGQILEFSTAAMYFILLAKRNQRSLQWIAFASTIVYFILLAGLLPIFSLEAPGWAFLAAQVALLVLYGLQGETRPHILFWFRRLLRPALAAIVSIALALFLFSGELYVTVVALCLFGFLKVISGELTRGDISSAIGAWMNRK